jgi:hypothetical protein
VIFPLCASADRELTTFEAKTLAKFEEKCVARKKKKSLCRCVARNVKSRVLSKDIDKERLEHVVIIATGVEPDEDEKPSYYDSLADFIEGLEFHCAAKPSYQIE